MKKLILSLLLATLAFNGYAKTWTVLSSGMTFSPETITIKQGDSVIFNIDASHNAVEVNQTVWNANGTNSNAGFSIPFGGGTALPVKLTVGTHYYVCTPHASFGMKGRIVVQAATGLLNSKVENTFHVYLNPDASELNVQLNLLESTTIELSLFDLQGKQISQLMPPAPLIGPFEQSFGLSGKKAGVYVLRLRAGNTTSFQKIVVH